MPVGYKHRSVLVCLATFLAAGCGRFQEKRMEHLRTLAERGEPYRMAIERFEQDHGSPPSSPEEAAVVLPPNLSYSKSGGDWSLVWAVNPDPWFVREFLRYDSDTADGVEKTVGPWEYYTQD